MRADDPRLEKSRLAAIERVKRVNEMIVTVLKNHLVLEQFMDEFLGERSLPLPGIAHHARAY